MGARKTIRVFSAVDDEQPAVQEFLNQELVALACPHKAAYALRLSIEELFINVAHYAYAPQTGDVEIAVASDADGQGVVVELRDGGVAFNPFERQDPQAPSSIEMAKIGGLGIAMVKRLMDSCRYERSDNQNVVYIHKRWDTGGGRGSGS